MMACSEVPDLEYGTLTHGVLWALTRKVDARERSKVPLPHAARMLGAEVADVKAAMETLMQRDLVRLDASGENLIRCLCETRYFWVVGSAGLMGLASSLCSHLVRTWPSFICDEYCSTPYDALPTARHRSASTIVRSTTRRIRVQDYDSDRCSLEVVGAESGGCSLPFMTARVPEKKT